MFSYVLQAEKRAPGVIIQVSHGYRDDDVCVRGGGGVRGCMSARVCAHVCLRAVALCLEHIPS